MNNAAVMLSIRPKWCELIASGKKTIEVRKTRPKLKTPFKAYIYRTLERHGDIYVTSGKVIGEFTCDKITNLFAESRFWLYEDTEEKTCLTGKQLREYANGNDAIYGWHISDLKIYDMPKKLSEFIGRQKTRFGIENFKMRRPPQSWCYVEELEA